MANGTQPPSPISGRSPAWRNWIPVSRFVFALAAGALLFWFVDLRSLGEALTQLTAARLATVVLMFLISCAVAIAKWRLLLPEIAGSILARFFFVGLFYSQILPGQLAGEAVKAYRLGAGRAMLARAAASVIVDRLTGLIGLSMVTVGGLLWSNSIAESREYLIGLMFLGLLGFIGILFAVRIEPLYETVHRLGERFTGRTGRVAGLVRGAIKMSAAWRSYSNNLGRLCANVLFGIVFQLIGGGIVFTLASALAYPISFSDACWVLGIVSIAVLLPISFGGLGVRELSFVGLLHLIHMPNDRALAL